MELLQRVVRYLGAVAASPQGHHSPLVMWHSHMENSAIYLPIKKKRDFSTTMLNCQRVFTEVSFIYTPVLTCETNACEFVVRPASLLKKHLDDDFIWQQPSVWPEDSHHFHLRKRGIPQNIRLDEKMRINHRIFLNSTGIPEILRCQTQEHSKRWPLRLLAGTFTWTGSEDRSWRVDGAGKTAFPRCLISGIWNRPKFWVHHIFGAYADVYYYH